MTTKLLLNHLWQSSFFVLFAGLIAVALRKNPAKVRYCVWLSASLKFLIPFALLVSLGSVVPHPQPHTGSVALPVFSKAVVRIGEPFSAESFPVRPVRLVLGRAEIGIGGLWVFGFLTVAVMRWRAWLRIRAALRAGAPIELPIPIRALITPGVKEPGIVGFWRPVLVLPEQLLEHLDSRQLAAILTHEMCHVRRRDNFFAAVHMVVEAIFWFHPLVWWIGSRMVEERELACDEEVMRMGCEPSDYVQGILKVCRLNTESSLPCIAGVTGADIKRRLRAILQGKIAPELTRGTSMALATAGVMALAVPVLVGILNGPAVRAQNASAASPKFEVASIKATDLHGGGMIRPFPGRFTARAPLRVLVEAAYHVQPFQIVGGPEWIRSDQYEVDAKATGNPEHAQMMLMLQSLLADRFQFRFHRESLEMPTYALEPARGGLKLPSPQEGSCAEEEAPPPGPGVPAPKPRCGGIDVPLEDGAWHMHGGKVPMSEFARVLTLMLGRTVEDRTGFFGVFDIDLRFRADDSIVGFAEPPVELDPSSPSIFSAVQQLGLRLESVKGVVEVLVVDHVERPSEN
jgi:uncharacterized protein (TIGR03435 family)